MTHTRAYWWLPFMADHDLPSTSGDFVLKFIWGVIVFASGFEGVVKVVEGDLITAGWCFIAAAVLGIALVHREKIAAFLRTKMTQIFIALAVVCAMGLGIAIGGLIVKRSLSGSTAQSTGRITWNFDQTASGQGYFLNMGRLNDEEIKIVGFGAHGKNTSNDPITQFSGYLRSNITGAQLPIYIVAQDTDAPQGPFQFSNNIPTRPAETFGIPGLADFDIVTHEKAVIHTGVDGMAVSKFLREFGSFTVVLEYDGTKFERHFSNEEVKKQIELFETNLNPQKTTTPRVTRRPNATPAVDPLLPFPTPAPTVAPTAK